MGDGRQRGARSGGALGGVRHDHDYFTHLRRKLRWQLLVAYLTPLVLLSVTFHFEYDAMLREGVDNHLKSVADNQRNTVDLFLQERVNNAKGALHAGVPIPPPEGLMQRALETLRRESTTFVDLGLFNPHGELVAYAGPHPSLIGKDYSGEAWFQKLMSTERDHVISDVYLGFRERPHFIIAVKRIIDHRPWAIRLSVDPERFGSFVERSYLIEDAEAFILNPQGQRQTLAAAAGQTPPPAARPGPRTPATRVEEVTIEGRRYLRAVSWLSETNWALVVRVPRDRAYAPLAQARWLLSGIALAALALILVVVLRSTRKLVARLESADAAKDSLRQHLFNAAKLASVGEMATGVAHEINNPLAIIYEEAAMLQDLLDPRFGRNLEPEELRERLAAIIEATMRGRTITGKLLAFARRHDPDPEPSVINLLLDRVIEVKEVDFSVSDIEVVRDFQPDLPPVMLNRNQIDQVMLNLLNNAKDAIGDGGTITLRTRRDDGMVRIDVTDDGAGMPPEVLEQVFFPFFTTKAVGRGTGLGLSISHGIIESHGGRIAVRSQVGRGTTFSVFLPLDPKRAAEPPAEDDEAPVAG